MYRDIPGYAHPYRISDRGDVEQLRGGKWVRLRVRVRPNRASVYLRLPDGRQAERGVFRLLDEVFCGGYAKAHGLCVGPKNGIKTDYCLDNMAYRTQAEIGRRALSRWLCKPVVRHDPKGNVKLYKSITEAAMDSGLSVSGLDRRLYDGVLDPRGYTWEVL